MASSRIKRLLLTGLTYLGITIATLVVVDVVLIMFGLFPPRLDYGDPVLGWRPAVATGGMALGRCIDPETGQVIDYQRNEDGVRTSLTREQVVGDTSSQRIAVVGDSHTDLCAPNALLHSGILESQLRSDGVRAVVFSYGAGKYSPLQDYLAFETTLKQYKPSVLILNLYTGNDFYDILRVDDRPHFVESESGYRIAPPVWYSLADPAVRYRSRVLYAARSLFERMGLRRVYLRAMELRRVAAQQGAGLPIVLAYIRDLWKAREPAVGYPDAFTSQMLNQQLFFYHFRPSRDESVRRMGALMRLIRVENPGMVLLMSPIPSYQLTGQMPIDAALQRTLERIPVGYEDGARQERELYEVLREYSRDNGWLFVDNLAALEKHQGQERLYNSVDYHLLPSASEVIGRAQAAALVDTLRHLAP